jgi:hypothetical protein
MDWRELSFDIPPEGTFRRHGETIFRCVALAL